MQGDSDEPQRTTPRKYKGIPSDTSLYFAIIKYVSAHEGPDRKVQTKISHDEGVTSLELTLENGLRFIYHTSVIGLNHGKNPVIDENLVIASPNGNSGRYVADTIRVKSYGEISAQKINSFYGQLVSKCERLAGRTNKVETKITDKEWPTVQSWEEEKTPVITNTPAQYLEQIEGELEGLYGKTPVHGVHIKPSEFDRMLLELADKKSSFSDGIKLLSLSDMSQNQNPVTGEAYSQYGIENKILLTLTACMEDIRRIPYDRLIAVPPAMSMKIAIDIGSREMIEPYLIVNNRELSDGDRAKLLHRMEKAFRKDLPIDLIEQYLEQRGRICLRMADYCAENADELYVYEMEDLTPSNMLSLFPKQGVVAFYTQYTYLLNEMIEHIMDRRGERLSDEVVDADRQVLKLDGLTVHFIGDSVRSAARNYMTGEHQVIRWRNTDSFPAVPHAPVDDGPSLQELLKDYVKQA